MTLTRTYSPVEIFVRYAETHGFTGHEHYAVKIINMKAPSKQEQTQACLCFVERKVLRDEVSTYGRLYDPVIARFFSPDNFVQVPGFTQSYNRYAYCLNNPLQYVDPSGESIVLAMILGAAANVVFQSLAGNINGNSDLLCSFFVGGLAGLAGGAAGGATAAAVGVGGFLGGAASGAAAGAASCFITGTGNALIAGNDLATSLKCGLMGGAIGALGGALMGGLSRGILDARHGYNFWDGSFYEEFASGEIDKSISSEYIRMAEIYDKSQLSVTNDRYLNARVYETYGIQQGDFNIDVITTRVSPIMKTQEPPFGLTGKGEYINLQTGIIVRGYVAGNSAIPGVEYHISPYITSNSIVYFKAVAGHELTHAYHRYIFGSAYEKIFSEVVAYRYTYNMYSSANLTKEAVITIRTALYHDYWWKFYPSSYKIPSPYLFY